MQKPMGKYTEIVRRAVEKADASNEVSRQAVYLSLRTSLERTILRRADLNAVSDDMRRQLERDIVDYEASFEPAEVLPQPTKRSKIPWFAGIGLTLIGIAIGATGAFAVKPKPAAGLHDAAALDRDLEKLRPALNQAIAYLEKIRAEVEAQQEADPFGLAEKAEAKFVDISAISPDLAKEAPKLAGGGRISVRASADGYKILLMSRLCTTAKFLRVDMVDPRRDTLAVGCEHFGLWNAEGAGF